MAPAPRKKSPPVTASKKPRLSQAEATINGYHGRFELVFDLAMDSAVYRDIRQSIQGTFRVIGGPIDG